MDMALLLKMRSGLHALLAAASFVLYTSVSPVLATPALPEESTACLACHGQQGLTITFANGEKLAASIDATLFTSSVHATLPCSSCHVEFAEGKHPERSFRSRDQYQRKANVICRQCHSDEQLKKSTIHASMLEQGGASTVCTGCHSAHSITAAAGGKKYATEKQYCLNCHKHHLSMTMKSGEALSLRVDERQLERSVHGKLSCFDCHFGFSTSQHPKRGFKNRRTFSITQSEACRRCHFDKYTKTIESIHYTMLSQGNLKAPVCTDCHGTHGIELARSDKSTGARRCGNCHAAIYATYASSVHGSALMSDHNIDVPVCVDCHTAHTIEDARTTDYRDKVPDICGRCHANRDIMSKYGLNTGVVNSYLQDFHGITLKFYKQQQASAGVGARKPIATCTDCHGIHDIDKTTGAAAATIKAKLTERCQKCHPGATQEFPDSWLSHYEPTLASAPLVFIIELFYKFFIPFMLVGLILQILLHLWRYTINR